ncbi:MAG TPA: ABC transporter transmembrane domain-containing protein, partial [Candidatus Brocadiales bacterium]|nr:ABC transporter transmembrane domain-containing protein [Candidatus Brocadiales bacterium]
MFGECTRLLAFARPYWKEWFLALVFMFLYTATSGAQLVLIKPVLDKLSKSSTLPSPPADTASPTTERPDSAAPQKNPQQDGIRDYLRQFIPEGLRTFWARHTNSYKGIGLLAIALAPLIFLFGYAQDYLKHFVMWRVYVDLSNRLCASLLPQSLSFFEARKSGELMSRLTNDLYFTQVGIVILFEDVMLQPLRLLCGLVLALYFSGKLFLLVLAGLPVMLFPVIFLGKKIRKHGKATLERMGWLTEALREILAGIRIIKAYKMEEEEQREFQEINEGLFKKRMKWSKAAILNQSSGEFFYAL